MIAFLMSILIANAQEDHVHFTAHVGASYILQTSFYGMNSKLLKLDKQQSELLALVETLGVGYLYKLSENASNSSTNKAMEQNLLGALLAIGTHVTFSF